jgi:isoamylase
MYLDGRGIRNREAHGRRVVDDSWMVWLHAGADPLDVQLPGPPWADGYELVVSTEYPTGAPPELTVVAPGHVEMPGRSVWLMRVLRRPPT